MAIGRIGDAVTFKELYGVDHDHAKSFLGMNPSVTWIVIY